MGNFAKLVLLAFLFEVGWAGYEWWRQVTDLIAFFSPPPSMAVVSAPARPMLSSLGPVNLRSRLTTPAKRGAEGFAPTRSLASIETPPMVVNVDGNREQAALEAAKAYLEEHRSAWNLRPYHEFRTQVSSTPMDTHVVFTAQQDGIDIEGMTIDLTVASDHSISGVANLYRPVQRAELPSGVDPNEALAQAADRWVPAGPVESPQKILALSIERDQPELAYWLPVKDRNSGRTTTALFRASDGRFLREEIGLLSLTQTSN